MNFLAKCVPSMKDDGPNSSSNNNNGVLIIVVNIPAK